MESYFGKMKKQEDEHEDEDEEKEVCVIITHNKLKSI